MIQEGLSSACARYLALSPSSQRLPQYVADVLHIAQTAFVFTQRLEVPDLMAFVLASNQKEMTKQPPQQQQGPSQPQGSSSTTETQSRQAFKSALEVKVGEALRRASTTMGGSGEVGRPPSGPEASSQVGVGPQDTGIALDLDRWAPSYLCQQQYCNVLILLILLASFSQQVGSGAFIEVPEPVVLVIAEACRMMCTHAALMSCRIEELAGLLGVKVSPTLAAATTVLAPESITPPPVGEDGVEGPSGRPLGESDEENKERIDQMVYSNPHPASNPPLAPISTKRLQLPPSPLTTAVPLPALPTLTSKASSIGSGMDSLENRPRLLDTSGTCWSWLPAKVRKELLVAAAGLLPVEQLVHGFNPLHHMDLEINQVCYLRGREERRDILIYTFCLCVHRGGLALRCTIAHPQRGTNKRMVCFLVFLFTHDSLSWNQLDRVYHVSCDHHMYHVLSPDAHPGANWHLEGCVIGPCAECTTRKRSVSIEV